MSNPDSAESRPTEEQARIGELEAILRDIARGAQMTLPYAQGAFASYVKEVARVATAGLPPEMQAALERLQHTEDQLRHDMQLATASILPVLEGPVSAH